MNNILENKDFYNLIASEYHDIISSANLVTNKKKLLGKIVKPKMKSAADIGCGTGVDSITLTKLGLKVTAFDPSPAMIKQAKVNAQKTGTKVKFRVNSIETIPINFHNQFDLAVSLGNTFANVSRNKFVYSLHKCFNILKSGGLFIIQILNYEKIVAEKKRIVNIKEGEKNYNIRFYDFIDNKITFNILIFNKSNPAENRLFSTRVYPYLLADFNRELIKLGFKSIAFYEDLELTKFDKSQSKDLFIISERK